MEESNSKRHKFLFCLVVTIIIVLNARQRRLYLHYWYTQISLLYHDGERAQESTLQKS